MLHNL
jgi:CspA family cold shock protein